MDKPSSSSPSLPHLTAEDLGDFPAPAFSVVPLPKKQIFSYILRGGDLQAWSTNVPDVGLEHLTPEMDVDDGTSDRDKCRLLCEVEKRGLGKWCTAYTCDVVMQSFPPGTPILVPIIKLGDNRSEKGLRMARDLGRATKLRDLLGREEPPKWFDVAPDYSRVRKVKAKAQLE